MGTDKIADAKSQARRHVAETLVRLTPSRRRAAGIAVAQRVTNLPAVRDARTIMAFLSLPTEIDTWPIIQWAWAEGKRVGVPRIEPADGGVPITEWRMAVVELPPADVGAVAAHPRVRPGPLGILDVPDGLLIDVAAIDVILAPCMAVDRRGNRLGKGGGFFDRFLAQPGLRAPCIVLAFYEQVLDEVPVTANDHPVDFIVTDAEVMASKGTAGDK